MNPSGSGWINKFGFLVSGDAVSFQDFTALYDTLKKTGFVYGINIAIPDFITPEHSLSEDEMAKVNLLNALYGTFRLQTRESDFERFLSLVFQFYKDLKVSHSSLLNKILTGSKTSAQLEKLIDSRVYLADNLISKTFNRIITNSLLCLDIFLFKRYLGGSREIRKEAESLEYLTINISYHALSSKEKSKSDERLAELFAASLSFIASDAKRFDGTYREKLQIDGDRYEHRYLLDIACMTVWEDKSLGYSESEFIFDLGKNLGFSDGQVARSMDETKSFFAKNADSIPFLKDTNAAVQLYDSMVKVVNKLILRNSKRLQKELSESKELVFLLSKSTVKDLSPEEKKRVQNQLIDIFKSIPSLAIFILPGGAVLLPIFIKMIPKLLPSSFDENRVEK
ncbi:LETM1-related biofilm-associated protein [Pricia sp. S334]|uniref:LETM1-related biofilm-associated protein n=1 Tax=Pricia mediterranea TaxID=3076079 RepID=A0ABU3LAK6_9FLAO|nr:LETM1-related biofilm-associated protein [Pricia sp. S334]MDT7830229.1 LETM1-related biofilm-associated protein [Pricia sp. S334]